MSTFEHGLLDFMETRARNDAPVGNKTEGVLTGSKIFDIYACIVA